MIFQPLASQLRFAVVFTLLQFGASTGIKAENWPTWRGPTENGASESGDPPLQWSEDKNVLWKLEIPGRGGSTPIIWGDRVYVLTAVPTDRKAKSGTGEPDAPSGQATTPLAEPPRGGQPPRGGGSRGFGRGGGGRFGSGPAPDVAYQYLAIAYDRFTGAKVWQTVVTEQVPHEPGHGTNTFASSSPITDGKFIYIHFGSRGIYCLDMQGNPQWERDLGQMRTRAQFGEAASPALHGETLIVPWDHEGQSFIAALNAKTGETLWKVDRDEATTWATPLITEHDGTTQVITNGKTVRSYDLKTGELIWQCAGQVENPIPTPIRVDDFVVCMTGYRGNAIYAISLDAKGDVENTPKVLWTRRDAAPYVASPTVYEGRLYFTKSRDAIVSSVDARTGEVVISQQRLPSIRSIYASPVAANDRIYITGREGATVVLRHSETFEVLATNQLDDVLDASPAIVGNLIYLRGEKNLYCIGNPAAKP
jgi:outer membrane protein assembly factor BamB